MPVLKSVQEVKDILSSPKLRLNRTPIIFGDEIDKLEKGQGLLITQKEWEEKKLKTPIANYYYSKYNKEGNKVISCRKEKDGVLVYKL